VSAGCWDENWMERGYRIQGHGPVIATAIHAGHLVRPELVERMAVSEEDRLREEDPYTGRWTAVGDVTVVASRSRFEVDLNRGRSGAIYRLPEHAWGLDVWREPPTPAIVERSLAVYDSFYRDMRTLIGETVAEHGRALIIDIHSYNHRRGGPGAEPDDPRENPEINVGTDRETRARWSWLVDPFVAALRDARIGGVGRDVRENVKFTVGHFPRWVVESFPDEAYAIAVEFRKSFMDEWTGLPDNAVMAELGWTLDAAVDVARALVKERGRS